MSASLIVPAVEVQPRRKSFTRSDVRRMEEAGVFLGQRFELIEGDLIDKMGQNPPHRGALALVNAYLLERFPASRVLVQIPIEASRADSDRSLPEPDLTVLAESKAEYWTRHPRGDELALAVEVADSSVSSDLTVKAKLYARAGVPEYWVLDIPGRTLVVHRQPEAGQYRQVTRLGETENVSPESCREGSIAVSALLPPA
ncbi:MAG: Uma2 family endonuclease [Bryobacteraceae bacterium]